MRLAPPWLIPLAVVFVGCAPKTQQFGGVPRSGHAPKVVSLSPSTTEIIASQFDVRMLAGRTEVDNYPPSVLTTPVVASVKPDFEKIKSVGPSLIVYDADLFNPDDAGRITAMGVDSFAFKSHTLDGFEKELYELSGKIGSETNVSGYVDRIEQEASNAKGDQPKTLPKVAVVMSGDYVAGTNSFVADIVKICGGQPVGPPSDKFAPMSPEAVVAAAPDIVVLATSKTTAEKDAAALRIDPRFANSPAIKNGHLSAIDQDVVLRRGTRVDKLVQSLHKAISLGAQGAAQ